MSLLQEKNKPIAAALRSGAAFTNPYTDVLNYIDWRVNTVASTVIEPLITALCLTLGTPPAGLTPVFTPSDTTNFNTMITQIHSEVALFRSFSNQLSGLTLSGEKTLSSVLELTLSARDEPSTWEEGKDNINTHPFYNVARSLLLKDEIIRNFYTWGEEMIAIVAYFQNITAATAQLLLLPEVGQTAFIRDKISSLYHLLYTTREYLSSTRISDETGWATVQREVSIKILAERIGSYVSDPHMNKVLGLVGSTSLKSVL